MNQRQETLFVFVTAHGRVMARLSDGTVADVTELCELLPRHACQDTPSQGESTPSVPTAAYQQALAA